MWKLLLFFSFFIIPCGIYNVGLMPPALMWFFPWTSASLNLLEIISDTLASQDRLLKRDGTFCPGSSNMKFSGAFGPDSRPAAWADLLPDPCSQECWGQDVTGFAAILGPVILWRLLGLTSLTNPFETVGQFTTRWHWQLQTTLVQRPRDAGSLTCPLKSKSTKTDFTVPLRSTPV